ncbi:MAG: 50S ribosomal protein L25, partial [Deinococcus sp.]|nr:50S ribosomal protein L25 [Deinococcus sp.]
MNLSANPRSAAARTLRRQGKIPAVVYGGKMEPLHLELDQREFDALYPQVGHNRLVDLTLNGEKTLRVLVKSVQVDPLSRQPIHADLLVVTPGTKVKVRVPVRLEGSPIGVRRDQGVLQHRQRDLEVECAPEQIPESISLDVSNLEINGVLHIRDLNIPQGVKVLAQPHWLVVVVLP